MSVWRYVWSVKGIKEKRSGCGGWISGTLLQPLQHPARSHKYGTGMSQSRFACLHFTMCMLTCLRVCVRAQSSVDLRAAPRYPLLIFSQNGRCQAEKFPNVSLMGLNGKLIHNFGLRELIGIDTKVTASQENHLKSSIPKTTTLCKTPAVEEWGRICVGYYSLNYILHLK